MGPLYRNATTFKLFWLLVAVFVSLNALLVTADDKPDEPTMWIGGLPSDEVVRNHVYNISWGGSMKPSNISIILAQVPDAKSSGAQNLSSYPLVQNTTDNPYSWNVTLPVGTFWSVMVYPNGGSIGMGVPNVRVLSKASSASKLLVTGASTLGFMLLALVALIHL